MQPIRDFTQNPPIAEGEGEQTAQACAMAWFRQQPPSADKSTVFSCYGRYNSQCEHTRRAVRQ
jgi:hypothetical protein